MVTSNAKPHTAPSKGWQSMASKGSDKMTTAEYRYILAGLALTQGDAAKALGVTIRTSNGYANGHHAIPEPVARLLRRLAEEHGLREFAAA